MLKKFAALLLACSVLLPGHSKADDIDPLDMFAVIAADEIKKNERMFQDAVSGFNLLGLNILRSSFLSSCGKMTSIKYLGDLSSFKDLEEGRRNFARPAVDRYDNMADHLAEFLYKVGTHTSSSGFKSAKEEMSWFEIRLAEMDKLINYIKKLNEYHKQCQDAAARMRKDFDEIASLRKIAPTPKKLSDSNAMKKYFKENPKMFPLKKANLRKMDIPSIYGIINCYKDDMSLNPKLRDSLKALDELAEHLKKLQKDLPYLEQAYKTWSGFLSNGVQYREKVREIAVHPRAREYFAPEFIAALTNAYQKHKDYYDMFSKEIDRGLKELARVKRFTGQEPIATMYRGSMPMHQMIYSSGSSNNSVTPFEGLQAWVEGPLCSKACR